MNIWHVHANKVVSVADSGIKKGGFLIKDNERVARVILSPTSGQIPANFQ